MIKNQNKSKKGYSDSNDYYTFGSIGSDESGTGSYFGPIVVAAVYISKENFEKVKEMRIIDSKKMSDTRIIKIMSNKKLPFKYESAILSPGTYNKVIKFKNMNKVLLFLHGKVIRKLYDRIHPKPTVVVDAFTTPSLIKSYLHQGKEYFDMNVKAFPRAESTEIAVATASMVARYYYLTSIQRMSNKYNINIPLGGSNELDAGVKFIKMYGADSLSDVAKITSSTTRKIALKASLNFDMKSYSFM